MFETSKRRDLENTSVKLTKFELVQCGCLYIMFDWVVVSNIFYFHPYLGKIPNLTNIFQRGWNHQLVDYLTKFSSGQPKHFLPNGRLRGLPLKSYGRDPKGKEPFSNHPFSGASCWNLGGGNISLQKLTAGTWKSPPLKRKIIFQTSIFVGFDVNFPGCRCYELSIVGFKILVFGVVFFPFEAFVHCCCGTPLRANVNPKQW